MPLRPCDAMTMRSQPCVVAVSMMACQGFGCVTWIVLQETAALLAACFHSTQVSFDRCLARAVVLAGSDRKPEFADGDRGPRPANADRRDVTVECLRQPNAVMDGSLRRLGSISCDQNLFVHGCLCAFS